MKWLLVAVSMVAQSARAQPPSQPSPLAPPPYPATAMFRLTLTDGRSIDVQIVGSDATNVYIRQAGNDYTLARTQIVTSVPLDRVTPPAAPPASAPPPVPPPAPPPPEPKKYDPSRRTTGWTMFLGSYLLTGTVALLRVNDDKTAAFGFLPVLGPVLWTGTDDSDEFGKDGWDWIGLLDTLAQGGGVWWILTADDPASPKKAVTVLPRAHRSFQGVIVQGSF